MILRHVAWIVDEVRAGNARFRKDVLEPSTLLTQLGWQVSVFADLDALNARITTVQVLIVARPMNQSLSALLKSAIEDGVKVFFCGRTDWFGFSRPRSSPILEFFTNSPPAAGILISSAQDEQTYGSFGWNSKLFKRVPRALPSRTLTAQSDSFTAQVMAKSNKNDGIRPARLIRRLRTLIGHRHQIDRDWSLMIHHVLFGTDDRNCVGGWLEGALDPGVWRSQRSGTPVILWDEEQVGPERSAGLLKLVALAPVLERVYSRTPFTLVVLGASRRRWQLLNRAFAFDSVYIRGSDWKRRSVSKRASLILQPSIPRSRSSTLAVRAIFKPPKASQKNLEFEWNPELMRQKPGSMEDFEQLVFQAIESREKSENVEAGCRDNAELVPSELTGLQWSNVLWGAVVGHPPSPVEVANPERLLVTINLIQDVPIALQVIDLAVSKNVGVSVLVGSQAVDNGSLILRDLAERAVPIRFIDLDQDNLTDPRWLENATILFCPSESSAVSHNLTHQLSSTANEYGVRTFTIQNGFEQAGLTFQDPDVGVCKFNSKTIFTWQKRSSLPHFISDDVRARCVGVGRLVPQAARRYTKLTAPIIDHFDVAIFENLHWGRYDQAYRDAFLEWCSRIALDFPSYRVLLQPHPAGRWTDRHRSDQPFPENLTVTKYQGRAYDFEQTAAVLASVTRVISSPSTILVDAAEAGCAVAVAVHGAEENSDYSPIRNLRNYEDWKAFLSADISEHFAVANHDFLDRVRMSGQPDDLVFEIMLNQKISRSV